MVTFWNVYGCSRLRPFLQQTAPRQTTSASAGPAWAWAASWLEGEPWQQWLSNDSYRYHLSINMLYREKNGVVPSALVTHSPIARNISSTFSADFADVSMKSKLFLSA